MQGPGAHRANSDCVQRCAQVFAQGTCSKPAILTSGWRLSPERPAADPLRVQPQADASPHSTLAPTRASLAPRLVPRGVQQVICTASATCAACWHQNAASCWPHRCDFRFRKFDRLCAPLRTHDVGAHRRAAFAARHLCRAAWTCFRVTAAAVRDVASPRLVRVLQVSSTHHPPDPLAF